MDRTTPRLFRIAMALVLATTLVVIGDAPAVRAAPNPGADWIAGDTHVHAAGDSGIGTHVRCPGKLDERACAELLVRQTLEQAKANGTRWIILTEHVPWLSMHTLVGTKVCFLWNCRTISMPKIDRDQGRRQYRLIRDAAARLQAEFPEVRVLMGQELGTAGEVTDKLDGLRHLNVNFGPETKLQEQVVKQLDKFAPGNCTGVAAGHLALYYTPDAVDDSVFDCDETAYLRNAERASAWGGVNHPDNEDKGSRWYCWTSGEYQPPFSEREQPPGSSGRRCEASATDSAAVRTVEIVNERNMPTVAALQQVDTLLLRGKKIALVGGGDSHTSRPANGDHIEFDNFRFAPGASIRLPRWKKFAQQDGDDGKIGLVGRTYVPGAGTEPVADHDPARPDDPIRTAIAAGRTVASTGPLAIPSVDGRLPGDTAGFTGTTVRVRVDFHESVAFDRPAEPEGTGRRRTVHVAGEQGDQVVTVNVVIGRVGNCARRASEFAELCDHPAKVRSEFAVTDEDRGRGYLVQDVEVPRGFQNGYLRTETLWGPTTPSETEKVERYGPLRYAHGAFSSPIYLRDVQADLAAALPGPGGIFGTVTGDPTTECCHGVFGLPEISCSSIPDRPYYQPPDRSALAEVARSYLGSTPGSNPLHIDVEFQPITPATAPVLADYLRRTDRGCAVENEESPVQTNGTYTLRRLPATAGEVAVAIDYDPEEADSTYGRIWIYGGGVLVSIVTGTDGSTPKGDRNAAEDEIVATVVRQLRELGWRG
ncbi:hypothetical protein AB0M36_24710 [Actinoplanes sp. NPDC051346]|uniref:hypothetical protein n=1 Tax=Actinoplanes sp. NPDC051346 TaxID=3155048 RepID=UPI0034271C93